jgi:hypothetical protein
MFLYLALFSVLWVIVVAELSVVWTFLALRAGDYRW